MFCSNVPKDILASGSGADGKKNIYAVVNGSYVPSKLDSSGLARREKGSCTVCRCPECAWPKRDEGRKVQCCRRPCKTEASQKPIVPFCAYKNCELALEDTDH